MLIAGGESRFSWKDLANSLKGAMRSGGLSAEKVRPTAELEEEGAGGGGGLFISGDLLNNPARFCSTGFVSRDFLLLAARLASMLIDRTASLLSGILMGVTAGVEILLLVVVLRGVSMGVFPCPSLSSLTTGVEDNLLLAK